MTTTESQPLFSTDSYIGLDGLVYPAQTKARYFPPADYEQSFGEVDFDIKKAVNIAHYINHANWWGLQTAGAPYSQSTIDGSIKHYEDLSDLMAQADAADPESRDWIDIEYWRIEAENQDQLAS